ncbi:hypothetical protein ALQ26_04208 [Pseudomonas amygdali pv. lachrymans]|nr:hypothetical protein ALQ26_04208 [Pseudomonas amygdali pv. lachrymans]
MSDTEHRCGGLDHLTFFGMPCSDDAISYCEQFGVTDLITCIGLLSLQRCQFSSRTLKAGACLLVFTEIGIALGQQ